MPKYQMVTHKVGISGNPDRGYKLTFWCGAESKEAIKALVDILGSEVLIQHSLEWQENA